jgi:Flp pilus assembly pilin Flp
MSMHSIAMHTRALAVAVAATVRAAAGWTVHRAPRLAQSTVEYAFVAAIVAVIAVAAVRALGTPLTTAFTNIGSQVTNAPNEAGGP